MSTAKPSGRAAMHEGRPVRLLTLTRLFPNCKRPRDGIFVANRLRKLCDTGRVETKVVAAIPWFPAYYRNVREVPSCETVLGFDVHHPRYLQVPAIGMRIQPDTLARALIGELRRNGMNADRFDLIDAHYFYPDGVAAARVAEELGLPLVITARGSDINVVGDIAFARQRMLSAANAASALIAVSSALAAQMIKLGMPADRMHVFRNGVDTDVFCPYPRSDARKRLHLSENGLLVLAVGNLVAEKGFDVLIRAISAIEHARLLVVGDGRQRNRLRALAQKVAPGRVEFRDNMTQSDLRFVYAAGDVLGLPSLREGWPNVVLEAIACGTPVAAAAVGGIPEILGPSAPGIVVQERSPMAWQRALCNLFERSLAPEAVRRYALEFGWEEVVARQCALYERVVVDRGKIQGALT